MSEKQKLVVIGNGMAGARLVEDIITRGGAEQFEFVMFGDEPYGNYNRILLSGVLSGSHDTQDIFINPLAWYAENSVKLHAGERVVKIDRTSKTVHGANGTVESYDKLAIATGSRCMSTLLFTTTNIDVAGTSFVALLFIASSVMCSSVSSSHLS